MENDVQSIPDIEEDEILLNSTNLICLINRLKQNSLMSLLDAEQAFNETQLPFLSKNSVK